MTRTDRIGVGVIGLGRGFTLMLPSFVGDRRFRLVAACEPDPVARAAFERDFAGNAWESVEDLCNDSRVDAVYIASPHEYHGEHLVAAVQHGCHVLVDKPLAISVEEGLRMLDWTRRAGSQVVVGPSHSFDEPVRLARALIEDDEFGAVRMIQSLNYTDFLYRPRRPEELDTRQGGGVVYSQAIHQVDVARLLAGGLATRVRALTGRWDPLRSTEGAYSAQVEFADGVFASLTYSGYGRFDSDEFMDWQGELGRRRRPEDHGHARRRLQSAATPQAEAELKRRANYGHVPTTEFTSLPPADAHEHFGLVIISCQRADIRLTAEGCWLYTDDERRFVEASSTTVSRARVLDEWYDAIVNDRPTLHSCAWGLASLEVAEAMLQSASTGRAIELRHQVPVKPNFQED